MIPGSETITIERRTETGEDNLGRPIFETITETIEGCLVAWGSTTTAYDSDRTLISTGMTAYLPWGTTVGDEDVLIIRDERYRRQGEAQEWEQPRGFNVFPGVVVSIEKAEG